MKKKVLVKVLVIVFGCLLTAGVLIFLVGSIGFRVRVRNFKNRFVTSAAAAQSARFCETAAGNTPLFDAESDAVYWYLTSANFSPLVRLPASGEVLAFHWGDGAVTRVIEKDADDLVLEYRTVQGEIWRFQLNLPDPRRGVRSPSSAWERLLQAAGLSA